MPDVDAKSMLSVADEAAGLLRLFAMCQDAFRDPHSAVYYDIDKHLPAVQQFGKSFDKLLRQLESLIPRDPFGKPLPRASSAIEEDYIHTLGTYLCDIKNAVASYDHLVRRMKHSQCSFSVLASFRILRQRLKFNKDVRAYMKSGEALMSAYEQYKASQPPADALT